MVSLFLFLLLFLPSVYLSQPAVYCLLVEPRAFSPLFICYQPKLSDPRSLFGQPYCLGIQFTLLEE